MPTEDQQFASQLGLLVPAPKFIEFKENPLAISNCGHIFFVRVSTAS
jgi:hypothetical protein